MRTGLLLVLIATATASETTWIGYGRPEGSRVYPGTAPTGFDHTTGEGVLWETPLPSWDHGSPIAVGGRFFVVCETGPEILFPLLVCIDGATGQVLGRREIDHLPAIGEACATPVSDGESVYATTAWGGDACFTFGDGRIYIRSLDSLIGIGRR